MLISTHQLSCERGDRQLFSQLNIELDHGELLYVEGHNGSGKTSLLRMLAGLLHIDNGEIHWQGSPIHKVSEDFRHNLLYLGHLNGIKLDLSALENLSFNCQLKHEVHHPEVLAQALEGIGLAGFEDIPARHMSQGQKRRVALAQLLVSKARLWILDEPFVALDSAAVTLLQQVIAAHLKKDGAVILTTHQEVPLTTGSVRRLQLGAHNA